jgi:hypothetical protein
MGSGLTGEGAPPPFREGQRLSQSFAAKKAERGTAKTASSQAATRQMGSPSQGSLGGIARIPAGGLTAVAACKGAIERAKARPMNPNIQRSVPIRLVEGPAGLDSPAWAVSSLMNS